jgi:DNA-binding HxlR family transcriptional regulator
MKDCPVKYALDVLSGKWTMYILYILTEQETIRFNELQRQVGSISALMLSRTLCELEKNGLVLRREFNAIPPHVEYSLTDLGRALTPALDSLAQWGHQVWLANGSPQVPDELPENPAGHRAEM